MTESGIKIICDNRNAYHNYFIEDKFEAGITLQGTEVKSLRDGKANLRDAYATFKNRELFLINAHITAYVHGNRSNHEPTRTRKLLLHRSELDKIWGKSEIKGYSLIPLKLYFKRGLVKCEVGIGRGKKAYDKRAVSKERDAKRELDKIQKQHRR